MSLFPKIRNRKKGNRTDFEMIYGRFKIYFIEKFKVIQLLGDIFIGLFFVTGSILNLMDIDMIYGLVSYLVGSIIMIVRPILKVLEHVWVIKK